MQPNRYIPSSHDIRFFSLAYAASQFSDYHTHHLGCVCTMGSKTLSIGFNSCRGHPLQKHYDRHRGFSDGIGKLHAEMMALLPLRYMDIPLHKVSVYVYRQHKNGTLALSRPCKSCMAAMKQMGIRHVYYTTENGYGYLDLKSELIG